MRASVATLLVAFALALQAQQQPAAPPPSTVSSSAGTLRFEKLAALEQPWGMALLPDGRLLITEKPGRLRIFANGRLSDPVQGVPSVVYRGTQFEQGGMMDVEADPDFARNNIIYLSFSEAAEQQSAQVTETGEARFGEFVDYTDNIIRGGAVARARLDGNTLRDLTVIWRQVPKTVGRGHFGVRILSGPDGKLYLTSGERMRFEPAQQLTSNLGKIIRINSDGSMPSDNPFAGRENARGDIYSYGHRNILAAAFEPSSRRLYAFEMGPLGGDELNVIEAGKNYGWPLVSNGDNYASAPIPDHPTRRDLQAPIRTWTPVISPSGAFFYTGAMMSAWRGSVLVGGLSSMSIIRLTFDGDRVSNEERIYTGRRMRDLLQAPDGAIYAIVDSGELLRIATAAPAR